MKLVLVEWNDASSNTSGWNSLDYLKDGCVPIHCRSVGWLAAEKNGHITIVPHLSGEKNGDIVVCGRGDLTIAKKMITKMTVLRKK